MIKRLKKYLSTDSKIAKTQFFTYMSMLANLGFGVFYTIYSTYMLSLYIGLTGICYLVFAVTKFFALNEVRLALAQTTPQAIAKIESKCTRNIAISSLIMSFIYFSFSVVITFFYDDFASYSSLMIYFIAGFTFYKIISAIVNSIRTRNSHSKIIYYLKLSYIANGIIALALTQRAIMYYTNHPQAKLISGIGGIFFSVIALAISYIMLIKSSGNKPEDKLID